MVFGSTQCLTLLKCVEPTVIQKIVSFWFIIHSFLSIIWLRMLDIMLLKRLSTHSSIVIIPLTYLVVNYSEKSETPKYDSKK